MPLSANVETEIKLRASPETLTALRRHPLLETYNLGGWQQGELDNLYYDTPALDLANARVALRVRRDGDAFVQTLKSRGQSVAGLSERNEWNWPLPSAQLDPSLLTDDCWPAALADLDKSLLQPLFSTDFVRQKAEIAWGPDEARVTAEAALDWGKVLAGSHEEEICELELELREGDPGALLQLAVDLATDLPLMPCDISKAERGYRLFNANNYQVVPPAPQLEEGLSVDLAFARLAWHLLGSSQRLAEQYRFNGHWSLLQDWLRQLLDLRALLSSLGQAVPRACSHQLRQSLDALLNDWQPLVLAGATEESDRRLAVTAFREELQRTRWGLWSLQFALWLHRQDWKQARNAQGERLGQLPVERWLAHQLRSECAKLSLPRYSEHPKELVDQLPRLQRVLVWLRLARGLLTLSEVDRLFGELEKLAQLARQADTAPLIGEQVARIRTLRAWKALTT